MTDYHEPYDEQSPEMRDIHRALVSLKEELEAIDWYQQRIALATDDDLRAILVHNRDEETEHAVMMIEWLRRVMPRFDQELRKHLFTDGPIAAREHAAADRHAPRDLGIGALSKEH